MLRINQKLQPIDLADRLELLWNRSGQKVLAIDSACAGDSGAPVFTVQGKYTPQPWTDWTRGFQFGWALLQFDATDDERYLELGREKTIASMSSHVSHMGVHDHGFTNISTYGNLFRLVREGRIASGDLDVCQLALKVSGAVQAARWSQTSDGHGYIYSFNGPHSLFADTMRSLRSLAIAHQLGHPLMTENDERISLLDRLIQHARTTAKYNVYYGDGRDLYDVRGRVAHESIFNCNDHRYRCPSTQQGYSPWTTWTRGLAWVMLGFVEQLEFVAALPDAELEPYGGRPDVEALMLTAALATSDFYIENTPIDGIPYWDTGAAGLTNMGDYLDRPADPFNDDEPVDSSAAAIAAQGLLRLGHYLEAGPDTQEASRYWQAGLTVLARLLESPYLNDDDEHHGLLLHSVFHRPRGWDYIPNGSQIPNGEASIWGDYHLVEVALYLQRIIRDKSYYTFFGPGFGNR